MASTQIEKPACRFQRFECDHRINHGDAVIGDVDPEIAPDGAFLRERWADAWQYEGPLATRPRLFEATLQSVVDLVPD